MVWFLSLTSAPCAAHLLPAGAGRAAAGARRRVAPLRKADKKETHPQILVLKIPTQTYRPNPAVRDPFRGCAQHAGGSSSSYPHLKNWRTVGIGVTKPPARENNARAVLGITWGGTLDTRGLPQSLTRGSLGLPVRMLRAANTPARLPAPLASVQAVVRAGLTTPTLRPPPREAQLHAVATAVVPAVFTPLLFLALAVPLTLLTRGTLSRRGFTLRRVLPLALGLKGRHAGCTLELPPKRWLLQLPVSKPPVKRHSADHRLPRAVGIVGRALGLRRMHSELASALTQELLATGDRICLDTELPTARAVRSPSLET